MDCRLSVNRLWHWALHSFFKVAGSDDSHFPLATDVTDPDSIQRNTQNWRSSSELRHDVMT
jgi:hypothetical protein